MKKFLTISACVTLASTVAAHAEGESGTAKVHPGHKGYLSSDSQGGGVPTSHFGAHGGPGYDAGPGGWGGAVSDTAKSNKGLPNAHEPD